MWNISLFRPRRERGAGAYPKAPSFSLGSVCFVLKISSFSSKERGAGAYPKAPSLPSMDPYASCVKNLHSTPLPSFLNFRVTEPFGTSSSSSEEKEERGRTPRPPPFLLRIRILRVKNIFICFLELVNSSSFSSEGRKRSGGIPRGPLFHPRIRMLHVLKVFIFIQGERERNEGVPQGPLPLSHGSVCFVC